MAAKKTTAPKKAAPKKAAMKKAAAPVRSKARPETASKLSTPKAAGKDTSPKAPKKAATIRLNDRQAEFLRKVKDTGEAGYKTGKGEQRTIDALVDRKLLKRGAKDKESGTYAYMISKTGEKYLTTSASKPEG